MLDSIYEERFSCAAVPRTIIRRWSSCNPPNECFTTMSYARHCFTDNKSRVKGGRGGGGMVDASFIEDSQLSSWLNGTPSHEFGQRWARSSLRKPRRETFVVAGWVQSMTC